MKEYTEQISDFSNQLNNNGKTFVDLFSQCKQIQKNLPGSRNGDKNDSYYLPYSSNPKPFGERWRITS